VFDPDPSLHRWQRLYLLPRVFMYACWAIGFIWGYSYIEVPPMPAAIGATGCALGFVFLLMHLKLHPKNMRPAGIPYIIALTIVCDAIFPAVMVIRGVPPTKPTTFTTTSTKA